MKYAPTMPSNKPFSSLPAWKGGRRLAHLLPLLLAIPLTPSMAQATEKVIASFSEPGSAANWISVNDGVMGGVSEGRFQRTDADTLLFSGTLSLDNNGGFASIRMEPRPLDLAGLAGIVVDVRGDGRTYWIEMRGERQRGATSYRAYLPTSAGEWTSTFISFGDFKLQSYGRQLDAAPLDPASVYSVGFMLADKTPGSFELEIASVKAVSEDTTIAMDPSGATIVEVAQSAGSFQTLLAAAAAAGLADVLSGEGPFTVFAPSDDAFAGLPDGTVEELLKPENKQKLTEILTYHVIAGRVSLAKALELQEGETLQGTPIAVAFEEGRVKIGPATLTQADIPASNGLIHVIDQVLLPPEDTRAPLTAASLIELAIHRGVPLFNHGNAEACAAVYEIACEALRATPSLCEQSHQELAQALLTMRGTTSDGEKAWVLRHAMDKVYARLSP